MEEVTMEGVTTVAGEGEDTTTIITMEVVGVTTDITTITIVGTMAPDPLYPG